MTNNKNVFEARTDEERLLKAIVTGDIDENITPRTRKEEMLKYAIDNGFDMINTIKNPIGKRNFPIITFVDDDGYKSFITSGYKKLYDAYGVKATIGIITSLVGTTDYYMSLDVLKGLKKEGFDIVSHSKTHDKVIFQNPNSSISNSLVESEFLDSKEFMIDNGFNSDVLLYPYGGFGSERLRYKSIARKYYKYAFASTNDVPLYNSSPLDNMFVNRYNLDKTQDFTSTVKPIIDSCIANNGWLVFFTHSYNNDQISVDYVKNVLDYVKSLNLTVLPINKALKYKENILSIGEYTKTNSLYVGNNGVVKGAEQFGTITISNSNLVINTDYESYIKQNGNRIKGSFTLTCNAQNFSYAYNDTIAEITGVDYPKKQVLGTGAVLAGGAFTPCYYILKPTTTGFKVVMQDSHSTANIRFMFINGISYELY